MPGLARAVMGLSWKKSPHSTSCAPREGAQGAGESKGVGVEGWRVRAGLAARPAPARPRRPSVWHTQHTQHRSMRARACRPPKGASRPRIWRHMASSRWKNSAAVRVRARVRVGEQASRRGGGCNACAGRSSGGIVPSKPTTSVGPCLAGPPYEQRTADGSNPTKPHENPIHSSAPLIMEISSSTSTLRPRSRRLLSPFHMRWKSVTVLGTLHRRAQHTAAASGGFGEGTAPATVTAGGSAACPQQARTPPQQALGPACSRSLPPARGRPAHAPAAHDRVHRGASDVGGGDACGRSHPHHCAELLAPLLEGRWQGGEGAGVSARAQAVSTANACLAACRAGLPTAGRAAHLAQPVQDAVEQERLARAGVACSGGMGPSFRGMSWRGWACTAWAARGSAAWQPPLLMNSLTSEEHRLARLQGSSGREVARRVSHTCASWRQAAGKATQRRQRPTASAPLPGPPRACTSSSTFCCSSDSTGLSALVSEGASAAAPGAGEHCAAGGRAPAGGGGAAGGGMCKGARCRSVIDAGHVSAGLQRLGRPGSDRKSSSRAQAGARRCQAARLDPPEMQPVPCSR